jgi:hypothetical protein
MPAPTGGDAAQRALSVFVGFSISAFVVVALTREFIGGTTAGVVFLTLAVIAPLSTVFVASNYWNIPYTASFLICGIYFLILIPSIPGQLVSPIFRGLGTVFAVLFIVGIGWRLTSKALS